MAPTKLDGMKQADLVVSSGGKVCLLKPHELSDDWEPADDERLTVWKMVRHLIRLLESIAGGELAAGELLAKIGIRAEIARERLLPGTI